MPGKSLTAQLNRKAGSVFFNGQTFFLRPKASKFEVEFILEPKEWQRFCSLLRQTTSLRTMKRIAKAGLDEFLRLTRGRFDEPDPIPHIGGINLSESHFKDPTNRFLVSIGLKRQMKESDRRHVAKTGLGSRFELSHGKVSLTLPIRQFLEIRQLCFDFERQRN